MRRLLYGTALAVAALAAGPALAAASGVAFGYDDSGGIAPAFESSVTITKASAAAEANHLTDLGIPAAAPGAGQVSGSDTS